MVTRNYRKRACGVVLVKRVKNPIKLAREMLIRGESDGSGGGNDGGDGDPAGGAGGAQGHCCLGGETVERLAKEWGLDMVEESYFWTKKRWDEHRRGLGKEAGDAALGSVLADGDEGWDGKEYLPQGTVGCVALDRYGTMCVATSTGGLTNKLPCRIGDTPTIGAGFWAEEWDETPLTPLIPGPVSPMDAMMEKIVGGLNGILTECIPTSSGYTDISRNEVSDEKRRPRHERKVRAVAILGTGNGDSFLRLAAARTAGAIVRFTSEGLLPPTYSGRRSGHTLASAVNQIAGIGGELQRSAEDRWGRNGEGVGGMIGIELRDGKGEVVFDFNCGGMFRCYIDRGGVERVMVFKDDY